MNIASKGLVTIPQAVREKGFEALYGFTTLKTVATKQGGNNLGRISLKVAWIVRETLWKE